MGSYDDVYFNLVISSACRTVQFHSFIHHYIMLYLLELMLPFAFGCICFRPSCRGRTCYFEVLVLFWLWLLLHICILVHGFYLKYAYVYMCLFVFTRLWIIRTWYLLKLASVGFWYWVWFMFFCLWLHTSVVLLCYFGDVIWFSVVPFLLLYQVGYSLQLSWI
jgi:hypothetical protein